MSKSRCHSSAPTLVRPSLDTSSPTAGGSAAFCCLVLVLLLSIPEVGSAQVQMSAEVEPSAPPQEIIDSTLSRTSADDQRPSISWDGEWIAFDSERDGNREIYVMDANGNRQRRLTYNEANDNTPAISPDLQWVVFQSNRILEYPGDRRSDLWLVDFEGKLPPRQLTQDPADEAFASFSPDGKWIVYSSAKHGNTDIFRMSTSDWTSEQLTDAESNEIWPSFSPDGKSILFFAKRDNNDDIYIMPADGGEEKRLTTDPGNDFVPAFYDRPDHIVFVSNREGFSRLYELTLGGEPIALTNPPAGRVTDPKVSPDGSFLIFVSDADDRKEIYRRSLLPEGLPEMILE